MTQDNNGTDTFALVDENAIVEDNFIEEIFPQVDPVQVEKELLEQFKEMQDKMPPEDVAAHFFRMYFPIYQGLLSGLSNKDARRVAEHVVQWPLEDEHPTFSSTQGKQAWQVGIRLIDCKMIMKGVFEMERLKEAQDNVAQTAADKEQAEKQEAIVGTMAEQGETEHG